MPRQKGRSLRSNTKSDTVQKDVRPPPAEFIDKYFYKDFGVHGVFVGVCVSVCINGHKNGRDDIYSVQYDDGDVESLQFRDVRKLLKKAGADHDAYLKAADKRKETLEALKKSEPAKHKQNQETAKRSTKITSDNATSHKQAKATAKANASDKSEKQSTSDKAEKTDKADKADKNDKTEKTETSKGVPKTPPKSPDKKPKRVSVPRRRKAKTKIEDEEQEKKVPKIDFNQPGFGWLSHQPTAITKITKRRYREVREYAVQWTNTGDTVTWEPSQNIHSKLVNDFERTYEEEVVKTTVKPPAKMTKQQKLATLANAVGLKPTATTTTAAKLMPTYAPLKPTYAPLTPTYLSTTTPSSYAPTTTPLYVPKTTTTTATTTTTTTTATRPTTATATAATPTYTPMTSAVTTTTPTYNPLKRVTYPIIANNTIATGKPMVLSSPSTTLPTSVPSVLSSSSLSSSSYTPYKPTYTTSKPLSTTMKSTHSPTKYGSTTKPSPFPPSFVNPLHAASRIGVPLAGPQIPSRQSTPTLTHLELEKRRIAVLSSYRSVLQFIEPPGWASACSSVSSLTNDALEKFPLVSFLEFYEHHFQEILHDRDVKIQQVETKLAEAEQQSVILKKQLEALSKNNPH